MKKVSVIVPVYNAERYLEQCLESLLNQTYKNVEIIVVNDGSSDASASIIESFLGHEQIIYLNQANSGPSVARNRGLELVTGDYIMFVDSDDYVDPELCERLLSKEADLVMCKLSRFSAGNPPETEDFSSLVSLNALSDIGRTEFDILYKSIQFNSPPCKLYKKSLLEGIFFPEDLDLGEDIIFNLHYLKKCRTLAYLDELLYYYRIGDGASLTNKFDANRIAKVYRVYQETAPLLLELFGKNCNTDAIKSNFLREACLSAKKMIVSSKESAAQKKATLISYLTDYDLTAYQTKDWETESLSFRLFFFLWKHRCLSLLLLITKIVERVS